MPRFCRDSAIPGVGSTHLPEADRVSERISRLQQFILTTIHSFYLPAGTEMMLKTCFARAPPIGVFGMALWAPGLCYVISPARLGAYRDVVTSDESGKHLLLPHFAIDTPTVMSISLDASPPV